MRQGRRLVLATALLLIAGLAYAQAPASYPDRPIRIVVPYPPGGGTDTLTRLVSRYMTESLKQPIVVENRPGAEARIGMDVVTKAPADGYTLLAIAAGPLNEQNMANFAPIALFAAPAYLLVVNPAVRANSVQELIALAKVQPGKLAYGSTGGGAASHLSTELFKAMTGTDMLHVPYKGSAQAINDLISGNLQLMFDNVPSIGPHARAGRVRALGVSSPKRAAQFPDVPAIAETVRGYETNSWGGIIGPAKLPREIVGRLNDEIRKALASPSVAERYRQLDTEPDGAGPEAFLALVRSETPRWAEVVKRSGAKVD